MRFFYKGKDGGPESCVDGFWLVEIKGLFSVLLLRFNDGAREAFHTHAFNAFTWFLWGDLTEEFQDAEPRKYKRRLIPKLTPRSLLHRVSSKGTSWVFTLRGPWAETWQEWFPEDDRYVTLTHGRKEI
jgi:hypothetical protein